MKGKLFFILHLFCLQLLAQQPAQYSLYMLNKLNFNPAYAGLDHSLSINAGIREQWVGIAGNPGTKFGSIHMPVYLLSGGVGIQLEQEELGPERNLSMSLSYAYQTFIGSGILSFGVGAGIYQKDLNGAKLRTPDGNYENNTIINHEDAVLPTNLVSGQTPTFRVGVYYQNDVFDAGISALNITEPALDLGSIAFLQRRNINFNAGAKINLTRTLSFQPSIFVKSDVKQTQTDISAMFQHNENIILGGSFRGYNTNSIDAAAIIFGFKLSENLRLAYAYDITLSELNVASNGSHELMIGYNLNKRIGAGRPPRIIYNPRNL